MAQLIKVMQVLDLFTEARSTLSAEEIAAQLGIPRTTAFRYVGELTEAGLLKNLAGQYSLGLRIIQLDYMIRRSDPLLFAGRECMVTLARSASCSTLLSSIYNDQVINIHHEVGNDNTYISFGRGRPLPLFQGAASKVILANLPAAALKKFYEQGKHLKEVMALGPDWQTFSHYFRECRKMGYYISHGEVDENVTGIAAPIFNADGAVAGSLSLVFPREREHLFKEDLLVSMVQSTASEITRKLQETSQLHR